jgi:hypothetical protein
MIYFWSKACFPISVRPSDLLTLSVCFELFSSYSQLKLAVGVEFHYRPKQT